MAKVITSTLISSFFFLFGDVTIAMVSLLILACTDFVLGLGRAFFLKRINSKKLWKGGAKKCLYMAGILLGNQIDLAFNVEMMKTIVVCYFVLTEASSIIENLNKLGVGLPDIVVDFIKDKKKTLDKKK